MPEGPELHLSSQYINSVCNGRVFSGKVRRNPIHKCSDITWDVPSYTISAVSRGKELKVFLQVVKVEKDDTKVEKDDTNVAASELENKTNNTASKSNSKQNNNAQPNKLQILFNFGMSGKFEFTSESELPKHAHLSFLTKGEQRLALSFVDYRRFGKWKEGADWSSDRGPCCMFEYPQFRSNILANLSDSAFNKPLCEMLLNQKYFNGIGNYLRAEICYRAKIQPFEQARVVFAALPDVPEEVKVKVEDQKVMDTNAGSKGADILELCNIIPLEVIDLGTSLYLPEDEDNDMSRFSQWLQCYYKPGMKNIADHNKRTMWFCGDPGPLVPKDGGAKKRHATYEKKLTKNAKKVKDNTAQAGKQSGIEVSNDEGTSTTVKHTRAKGASGKVPVRSPVKTRGVVRKLLDKVSNPDTQSANLLYSKRRSTTRTDVKRNLKDNDSRELKETTSNKITLASRAATKKMQMNTADKQKKTKLSNSKMKSTVRPNEHSSATREPVGSAEEFQTSAKMQTKTISNSRK